MNRDFVVLFGETVTASSSNPYDWIARKGDHCLFELMLLLAPKVNELKTNVVINNLDLTSLFVVVLFFEGNTVRPI